MSDGYQTTVVYASRAAAVFADLDSPTVRSLHAACLRTLGKCRLVDPDDWGPERLTANQRRD